MLACVQDINGRLGAGMIRATLLGSREQRVREWGLDRSPHYGKLRGMPKELLRDIVDEMIERGYLAASGGKYPVVRLGPRAQAELEGETVMLRAREVTAQSSPTRRAPQTLTGEENGLFDMLRALRLRIAEKRGLPAYMIFNDATLRNMCAMKPQTPEQLLAVPGVGEAKLRNYGGEFLRAIAHWKKE